MLARKLAEHRHAGDVGRALAKLGVNRGEHIALAEGIEDFRGADDFEIAQNGVFLRRECRRPAQAKVPDPQARACELSVVGGGILCGRFVEGLGLLALAHRLGCAALPVPAAGEGMRVFCAFDDM